MDFRPRFPVVDVRYVAQHNARSGDILGHGDAPDQPIERYPGGGDFSVVADCARCS